VDVQKMVTQERWEKTKNKIDWMWRAYNGEHGEDIDEECPQDRIPHKQLESIRGFLVYVARTYSTMVPYLKGIHLTLDSWRDKRGSDGWPVDEDGWRISNTIDDKLEGPEARQGSEEPPKFVRKAGRLGDDLRMLRALTRDEEAPKRSIRSTETAAAYMFGDASGGGFGTSLWLPDSEVLDLTYGTWRSEVLKQSSNFREFANFVRKVEHLVREKKIKKGTELWLFTDNFVTEMVWHKGSAKSRLLHGLVQRLRKLEMNGELFIQVVWVAGTRMIKQGTNGLSRGDLFNGILAGKNYLDYIPLDKGALEQSPELEGWLKRTFPRKNGWNVLDKEGWFEKGFEDGNHIWAPPPGVADAVLDNMWESVLIRPWNSHIFVCPALLTAKWRKQLRKVADFIVTIPVGSSLWPHDMCEPIVLALTCPLLNCSPWKFGDSRGLAELEAALPRVWSPDWDVEGDRLREFWRAEVPDDPNLLWGLARRLLSPEEGRQLPSASGERLGRFHFRRNRLVQRRSRQISGGTSGRSSDVPVPV
jgi:hypothetical protein